MLACLPAVQSHMTPVSPSCNNWATIKRCPHDDGRNQHESLIFISAVIQTRNRSLFSFFPFFNHTLHPCSVQMWPPECCRFYSSLPRKAVLLNIQTTAPPSSVSTGLCHISTHIFYPFQSDTDVEKQARSLHYVVHSFNVLDN